MQWIQYIPGKIHSGLGIARQIGMWDGLGFIYLLERLGTKDDAEVPRFVAGIGKTHADALTNAMETVAQWDRAARIVWADDPQHPAQQAHSKDA